MAPQRTPPQEPLDFGCLLHNKLVQCAQSVFPPTAKLAVGNPKPAVGNPKPAVGNPKPAVGNPEQVVGNPKPAVGKGARKGARDRAQGSKSSRAREQEIARKGARYRAQGARDRAQGSKRSRAREQEIARKGARDRAQGARDRAQGARDRAQGARDRAQGARDRAQGSKRSRARKQEIIFLTRPAVFLLTRPSAAVYFLTRPAKKMGGFPGQTQPYACCAGTVRLPGHIRAQPSSLS
eukprot:gene24234-biopygen14937